MALNVNAVNTLGFPATLKNTLKSALNANRHIGTDHDKQRTKNKAFKSLFSEG